MQLAEFQRAPQKERHPAYEASMFANNAPEYSTGEVLLASAYRGLLLGVGEGGIDLDNITKLPEAMPVSAGGRETWSRLLLERGGIASPLRHGQYSPLKSRQLMPIVPSIARIAGVLGKPRSRWNPFNLLLEVIGAGLGTAAGDALIQQLGSTLAVNATDDAFARFIEESMQQGLKGFTPEPQPNAPYLNLHLDPLHARAYRAQPSPRRRTPSERFCQDLPHVLQLKKSLTRRQWTVFLEALFRIGLGMHVLWNCRVNAVALELVLDVLAGNPPPSATKVEEELWLSAPHSRPLLEIGSNAEPLLERLVEQYAFARTGLNVLLCRLEDAGVSWQGNRGIGFDTQHGLPAPNEFASFLSHLSTHRTSVDVADPAAWLRGQVGDLFDKDLRELAKRDTGYTRNLFFFARHSLGQVKAKDPEQRCYDLAYLLAYGGDRKPIPVQPGPAMLVTLVHVCCAANPLIPISLEDFRQHLAEYGLHVPAGELIDGKTGRDLAILGLVVDSPDAAGGRLLVPPF
jgi:hypothetical protein